MDFHFFVNLRSGNLFTNGILLTAGAGINSASEAKDEWLETENKIAKYPIEYFIVY